MNSFSSELQSLIDVQENPFVLIDENYRIVAANLRQLWSRQKCSCRAALS
jgi:hypothetical protein